MLTLFLATLSLSTPAQAGVYAGNPTLQLELDRAEHDLDEALVTIDQVDVVHCDQSTVDVYAIDEEVDLVAGWSLVIDGGNLCRIVVDWTGPIEVAGTGFTLEISRNTTTLILDEPIPGVVMAPFTVTSGNISGSDPVLWSTLD